MRYIKVLLLVVIFFLTIVFFFQNQEILNKDTVLKVNLFFLPPWSSMPLPLYFLLLLGFLVGALLTLIMLVWDKFCHSAKLMKAHWRIRTLEKEVITLQSAAAKVVSKQKDAALPPAKVEAVAQGNAAEPAKAVKPATEASTPEVSVEEKK